MHVTACLAGQKVDVEVGEDCRSLQALRECIVKELPQLCVEGFDVSVGGRALDDDEGIVSLGEDACLDVTANARGLSVLALREAGREVSEAGLLRAAVEGDVALVTLFLDAGVPVDCVEALSGSDTESDEERDSYTYSTSLHLSCSNGHLAVATLLLDRGSRAIDAEDVLRNTPLHLACCFGYLLVATLLLDRGSRAIEAKNRSSYNPLHLSCRNDHLALATLLLDRGSAIDAVSRSGTNSLHLSCRTGHLSLVALLLDRGSAIDKKNGFGYTPLQLSCHGGHPTVVTFLLDRGSNFSVDEYEARKPYPHAVLGLLSERGYDCRG